MSSCGCPELTGTWWRDPATLRTVLDNHDGPTDAAQAHGAIQSTLSVWSRRHGFPKGTPGGKPHRCELSPELRVEVPWGHGEAKLLKPSTKEATEVVVFGSDFHVPYHDTEAVASFLRLLDALQPHRVFLNGDIADFFQLSRFNKDGSRGDALQEEIDQANALRRAVRAAAANADILEGDGNHDSRIRTWLAANAGVLRSLRALSPEVLFEYRDHGISWYPGCGALLRKHFLVKHGTIVRKGAGATAKAELETAGVSGLSGHTHRLSTFRRNGYSQRQWTEGGGFFRMDPDYVTGKPDWCQGCVVGEFSTKTDAFALSEAPFVDGKLRLGREAF